MKLRFRKRDSDAPAASIVEPRGSSPDLRPETEVEPAEAVSLSPSIPNPEETMPPGQDEKPEVKAAEKMTDAVETKTCRECGAEVPGGAKYCTRCAAPLGEADAGVTCTECGADVPAGAKYCTSCSAPMAADAREGEGPVVGLQPWAIKAGERVRRMGKGVKIGVPLLIIFIIAAVVALLVVANGHSPQSAVERYLSNLQVGEYRPAYDMVSHPGGSFSSYDYFVAWQNMQTDNLGRLEGFKVRPRQTDSRLFGKVISTAPENGTPFVATLEYKSQSFDVNINVEGAGGTWPVKKYRLQLSEESTRAVVAPEGARIYVDGKLAGKAEPVEGLVDAMSLGTLPDNLDEAVDYAKRVVRAVDYLVGEFKRIARELDTVTEDAQKILDRFGSSGVAWQEVLDSVDSAVEQSKEFSSEVARAAIHIYWMFGGGDDGSIRAKYTRMETGIELNGLPEGFHEITVRLDGCDPETQDWNAPSEVEVTLNPDAVTKAELKGALGSYYAAVGAAGLSGDPSMLADAMSGTLLDQETAEIDRQTSKGYTMSADLLSVKYSKFKMLAKDVATVETNEVWNYTTLSGGVPVSQVSQVKRHVIYTVEVIDGRWTPVEKKLLD